LKKWLLNRFFCRLVIFYLVTLLINQLRQKIGAIEKQRKNKKFSCLYPNCTSKSIGSHSQQRGGQLSLICEDDDVYAFNPSLYDVVSGNSSAFKLIKTKIKNASIYPGYCQIHDGKVFSPIEKSQLEKDNDLQSATFFLRTITYEVTRKKLAEYTTEKILEDCKGLISSEIERVYRLQLLGRKKFISVDLPYYLKGAYEAYNNPSAKRIDTHWVFIPEIIKASTCTVFSPIDNFNDRLMDQINGVQVLSTFNLVPTQSGTHIVVSWFKEHANYNKWVVQALESELERFINYVAICESEDTCIGPELWRSVDVFTMGRVYHAIQHEVYRGPLDDVPRVIRI
jgi:hypothetical protein